MAELKTKENDADVNAFVESIENQQRKKDTIAVVKMMERVSGHPAKMWGSSIIGFDSYAYTYESGRSGEWMIAGVSPRKAALTVYIMPGFDPFPDLMEKLGKYKTGKSCLYLKKLEDVDLAVLEELAKQSIYLMRERYPR